MNRGLFRSLFLYCAKHKHRGYFKVRAAETRKQKTLDQHREDLLSF